MIHRYYVERRPALSPAADNLLTEAQNLLGIGTLESVRVLHRYDVTGFGEAAEAEAASAQIRQVLAEAPLDLIYDDLPTDADWAFGREYLPGQFDQRADAAEQVLQAASSGSRPRVDCAEIYLMDGPLSETDQETLENYLINPVVARKIDLTAPPALRPAATAAEAVPVMEGFINLDEADLARFAAEHGFAMDLADLRFCQDYFRSEGRDPSEAELKVIDTYWSDHCRHTTFLTELTNVSFEDTRAEATFEEYLRVRDELGRTKPVSLMDLGTIAAKYLQSTGALADLDESPEINACTVRVDAVVDGTREPWLLYFKNETHNHPTEIEPFGGAATCVGGAIRDPLSGRAYVYQAMRVTGAADPRTPLEETLPGKLPQRQIVTQAAEGYSSYANEIGLPAGVVEEIYHPGYVAKRMEMGAVVGAAPASNVRREVPADGDVVVLLGGRTGRDGLGGATGSSVSQTAESAAAAGAEVQRGNAPEERKIQRLFRDSAATRLIKRSNDFGAGGVSVAVGELADGLNIDLDLVPTKYEGLSGTELAISESQERMAVVLAQGDVEEFLRLAAAENLEATPIATVTDDPRLVMVRGGETIVDLSRAFLDSNGVAKQTSAAVQAPKPVVFPHGDAADLAAAVLDVATDLNVASQRGLVEQFDSTAGGGTVLAPLGGRRQLTPTQVMAAKLPVLGGETTTSSVMAYGYDPFVASADPYAGGYLAVVDSLAKLVASGASLDQAYLTFQEFFPRLDQDPARWGLPVASLLGALRAQLEFGVAAIGGKDSMSGSFEGLDVPPTLVSVAVAVADAAQLISPEFKTAGSNLLLVEPATGVDGLPQAASLAESWGDITEMIRAGQVRSAWALGPGGLVEALVKMAAGNRVGVRLVAEPALEYGYGSILLEVPAEAAQAPNMGMLIGRTTEDYVLATPSAEVDLEQVETAWTGVLEEVFPTSPAASPGGAVPLASPALPPASGPALRVARPSFLIPVFPGTSGEFEAAAAVEAAGGKADVFVLRNLTSDDLAWSADEFARRLRESQVLFLPSGAATGNEPGAAAKFITATLRRPDVANQVAALLEDRGGLILGIANGFQALIKTGLLPYGTIREASSDSPALAPNAIGRHQSRLVRVRVTSVASPWMSGTEVGQEFTVPFSSAEGRFTAPRAEVERLLGAGQVVTQYVNFAGEPTMETDFNPAGSLAAVEGLVSPDGRVLGKMGNAERAGRHLYLNVPGELDMELFRAAVRYYQ